MDKLDHVAIQVNNLEETLKWYLDNFNAKVVYQDSSWAMLEFDNIKLAFVLASQHPAHIAFEKSQATHYGRLKKHRDGTLSTYVKDPSGNIVEILQEENQRVEER
ncbi:VOC family protein [Fangia hongkongensis]|uniref:VOC family protein n=1 Tax=Fangia hongkongensis TaxID=270495 RepID=UPI00036FFFFE|nr:VOC family protein [Fangia hongkongensis]MBK2123751.1 VOC family protein [Fangia hongkongensis]